MNFTLEQIEPMLIDNGGFCIECGAEHYGIEPDAHEYRCEACGQYRVYGAEELLIMGHVV